MSFPIKIQKVQVQQNDGTISNPIPLSTGVNIRQGEVETAVDIAHNEPIGAFGEYSIALGQDTKATAPNQTVVGQYNAENNDALFIVGDGTSESARSNAFEVLKNNTAKVKNLIVENNLTGVASRSIADEHGNNIATTYANKVVEEAQYDIAYDRSVPANLPTPWSKVTKVGGMSYKTKNLINYPYNFGNSTTQNGITVTANSDGSLTINGTTTAYCWIAYSNIKTEIGKQYTARAYNCPGTMAFYMFHSDSDATFFRNSAITITARQNYYTIVLAADVGYTYNNVRIYPMVNEGSTILPYEPYYEGLRDSAVTEIKSIGVNLLNPNLFPAGTYSGVTFTPNADGSITANGTATGNIFYDLVDTTNHILKPGSTYYVSFGDTFIGGQDVKEMVVGIITNNLENKYYAFTAKNKFIFTFNNNDYYKVFVRLRSYAGAVFNNETYYPILAESSAELPYTSYKENVLAIPAEVQAFDGYGLGINQNRYNYLEWQPEDNIKTWHKNVHKVVFDGTESWSASATESGNYRFRLVLNPAPLFYDIGYATPMVCSHYNAVTAINTWQDVNGVSIHNNEIMIKDSNYSTNVAWKAYLAEQYAAGTPVTLVYAIATPTVTDVTEIVPDDNLIRVEEGGTIYAENSYRYEAPLEIIYHVDINEARKKGLAADDMKQSVTRAVYAETALSFSGTSLTIGNTTLTEAQLQKLLALLNEIEFV